MASKPPIASSSVSGGSIDISRVCSSAASISDPIASSKPPIDPSQPRHSSPKHSSAQKRVVSSTESSPSASPLRPNEQEQESGDTLMHLDSPAPVRTSAATTSETREEEEEESSVVTNASSSSLGAGIVSSSRSLNGVSTHDQSFPEQSAQVTPIYPSPEVSTDARDSLSSSSSTKPLNDNNNCTETSNSLNASFNDNDASASLKSHPNAISCNEDKSKNKSNNAKEEEDDKKSEPSDVVTFANVSNYSDAGKTHPESCPVGGSWKGYFENVQVRKDRKSSRVPETFFLFFNSSPPQDAQVSFEDFHEEDESGEQEKSRDTTELLPDQIHVRGTGSNQFGTFEILGSFDLTSSVLHCRRVYLQIQEPTEDPPRKTAPTRKITRGISSKSKKIDNESGTQNQKTHFTRKKQASWRRHDTTTSESENEEDRRQQQRNRKRPRQDSVSQSYFSASPPTCTSVSSSQEVYQRTNGTFSKDDERNSSCTKYSAKKGMQPSGLSINAPDSLIASKSMLLSSDAPKKLKHDQDDSTTIGTFLPLVPAKPLARWKAAHIFNRSKKIVDGDVPVATPGSSSGNDSYIQCVYEGETKKGGKQREGFGVCLYENGNIYEGSWRRNKEHGKGKLMTGDRRFIIYEGDWERGRIHGSGLYFYSTNTDVQPNAPYLGNGSGEDNKLLLAMQRGGGVYKGDFKENCRHGFGIYTLPDGSVYDGEWRDNMQCGRGKFRWVDGSTYDGQWKDGKRHGIGTLKASDGFVYEGQWITNAMDGRGWCLYPNGQRYEGLWSKGRKEGRGTIRFSNGAVYEGRFKDDWIEGQGTMKITSNVVVRPRKEIDDQDADEREMDWMIPIEFQSDMGHIHQRAGFTMGGI